MKIQPCHGQKTFASHVSGKDLVYEIHKEFLQLKDKKDNPI